MSGGELHSLRDAGRAKTTTYGQLPTHTISPENQNETMADEISRTLMRKRTWKLFVAWKRQLDNELTYEKNAKDKMLRF